VKRPSSIGYISQIPNPKSLRSLTSLSLTPPARRLICCIAVAALLEAAACTLYGGSPAGQGSGGLPHRSSLELTSGEGSPHHAARPHRAPTCRGRRPSLSAPPLTAGQGPSSPCVIIRRRPWAGFGPPLSALPPPSAFRLLHVTSRSLPVNHGCAHAFLSLRIASLVFILSLDLMNENQPVLFLLSRSRVTYSKSLLILFCSV
jgi:hypothetical protein